MAVPISEYPIERSSFSTLDLTPVQKNEGVLFQFVHRGEDSGKDGHLLKIEYSYYGLVNLHFAAQNVAELFKQVITRCGCKVDSEFNLHVVHRYLVVVKEPKSKCRQLIKTILRSNEFIGTETYKRIAMLCDILGLNVTLDKKGPDSFSLRVK